LSSGISQPFSAQRWCQDPSKIAHPTAEKLLKHRLQAAPAPDLLDMSDPPAAAAAPAATPAPSLSDVDLLGGPPQGSSLPQDWWCFFPGFWGHGTYGTWDAKVDQVRKMMMHHAIVGCGKRSL